MAKKSEVAIREEFDLSSWDWDVQVAESRAEWERWKGISTIWYSATVDLSRRLWAAQKALASKNGKRSDGKTVKDFIEAVGLPKSTFYRLVKQIDDMASDGVDVMALPGDEDLYSAKRSSRELDLEKRVKAQEVELAAREKIAESSKETLALEKKRLREANEKIRELSKNLGGSAPPSADLQRRIKALEVKEQNLTSEIDWWSDVASFQSELQLMIEHADTVSSLGRRLLRPKAKRKGVK